MTQRNRSLWEQTVVCVPVVFDARKRFPSELAQGFAKFHRGVKLV
jgi:hypothetical protein